MKTNTQNTNKVNGSKIFNAIDNINEVKNRLNEEKVTYNRKIAPLKRNLKELKNDKFRLVKSNFIGSHKRFTKDCKSYRQKHKKFFLTLDILIIVIILSNFGALLITNALVIKVNPDREFIEANPVVAEMKNFKTTPQANQYFKSFIFFTYIWSLMTFIYVLVRNHIRTEYGLYLLTFVVISYFIGLHTDFINDLGYYLGTKLW